MCFEKVSAHLVYEYRQYWHIGAEHVMTNVMSGVMSNALDGTHEYPDK